MNEIDEYISQFPKETADILNKIRSVIKEIAPEAKEKISYQVPTFYLHGNFMHFGAYKNHVSIYPGASGIENFKGKLTAYKTSKGTVQFPIDKPIPYELIGEITRFRIAENQKKAKDKTKRK